MKIMQSASRVVFVSLTLALIGLTAFGIVDAKDFIQLTGLAFVYYFTKPQTNNPQG